MLGEVKFEAPVWTPEANRLGQPVRRLVVAELVSCLYLLLAITALKTHHSIEAD